MSSPVQQGYSSDFASGDTQPNQQYIPQNNELNSTQPIPQENVNQTMQYPQYQQQFDFSQRSVQHKKFKRKYIPKVLDDSQGCITFVAKIKVDSSKRASFKNYSQLNFESNDIANSDTVDIGRIYVKKAYNHGEKIKVELSYIDAKNNRLETFFFVNKSACKEGKLYNEFVKQGITCFNTDLTNKKISEYLYELILSKMDGEEEYFPWRCGFDFFCEKIYFVTSEFCERSGYPPVIKKSFVVELPNDYASERAEKDFVALAKKHNSKEQFMLLNMMRVSGLFSNILSNRYIEFDKIIFIDGDAEKLTKYLQIYDREYEVIKPYSINVKNDVIKSDIEDKSSDVVIFEDRKTATDFTKKNGVEAINFLRDIIYYDNYN